MIDPIAWTHDDALPARNPVNQAHPPAATIAMHRMTDRTISAPVASAHAPTDDCLSSFNSSLLVGLKARMMPYRLNRSAGTAPFRFTFTQSLERTPGL